MIFDCMVTLWNYFRQGQSDRASPERVQPVEMTVFAVQTLAKPEWTTAEQSRIIPRFSRVKREIIQVAGFPDPIGDMVYDYIGEKSEVIHDIFFTKNLAGNRALQESAEQFGVIKTVFQRLSCRYCDYSVNECFESFQEFHNTFTRLNDIENQKVVIEEFRKLRALMEIHYDKTDACAQIVLNRQACSFCIGDVGDTVTVTYNGRKMRKDVVGLFDTFIEPYLTDIETRITRIDESFSIHDDRPEQDTIRA